MSVCLSVHLCVCPAQAQVCLKHCLSVPVVSQVFHRSQVSPRSLKGFAAYFVGPNNFVLLLKN